MLQFLFRWLYCNQNRLAVSLTLMATLLLSLDLPFAWGQKGSGRVNVRGYTRKDGTYVRPHTRSSPGSGNSSLSGSYSLPSSPSSSNGPYYGDSTLLSPSKPTPDVPSYFVLSSQIKYQDGNRITVKGTKSRIVGILLPAKSASNYKQAQTRLSQLLATPLIGFLQVGIDEAGQPLVKVFINGEDIADILRREGLSGDSTTSQPIDLTQGLNLPPFPTVGVGLNQATESKEVVAGALEAGTDLENDLVPLQLKIVVLDDLTPKPVPFTDFALKKGDATDPVTIVRTDERGQITLSVPAGDYVLESQHGTKFKGRNLFWKREFSLQTGTPFTLTLTDADASELSPPAPNTTKAPNLNVPVPTVTPVKTPVVPRVTYIPRPAFDTLKAKAQILARYQLWKQTWASKNLNQLLGFYSPEVLVTSADGDVYDYATLKTKVSARWNQDPYLRLDDVSSPLIRFYGEKAILTVTQKYHSPSSGVQGQKKLGWEQVGNQWVIVEEGSVGLQVPQTVRVLWPSVPAKPKPAAKPKTQGVSFSGEKFAATRYRMIDESEACGWTDEQLRYAINEMFARHGLDFSVPEVKAQFARFSWYQPIDGQTAAMAMSSFNAYEKANLNVLGRVRRARQTVPNIE